MFRGSSKFCVASLALALVAFISTFIACGDSGTSPNGGDSSSSAGPNVLLSSAYQPKDTIDIEFAAGLNGSGTSLLMSGVITVYEGELDYYVVKLSNGKEVVGRNTNTTINESYTFSPGTECCDGNEYQAILYVRLKGSSKEYTALSDKFSRNVSLCAPSSASVPSSSSVDTRQFSPLNNLAPITLNAAQGTRGVSFDASGMSEKPDAGSSHIYYDKSGTTTGSVRAGTNVKILSNFSSGGGCPSGDRYYKSSNDLGEGVISNPQTLLACFGFRETNMEQAYQFQQGRYFMVRTNGVTGDLWTANDYLVAFTDERDGSGNTVKIVAWKLQ